MERINESNNPSNNQSINQSTNQSERALEQNTPDHQSIHQSLEVNQAAPLEWNRNLSEHNKLLPRILVYSSRLRKWKFFRNKKSSLCFSISREVWTSRHRQESVTDSKLRKPKKYDRNLSKKICTCNCQEKPLIKLERPINQSIDRSIRVSTYLCNQSINQTINQSINQSNEWICITDQAKFSPLAGTFSKSYLWAFRLSRSIAGCIAAVCSSS